MTRERSAVLDEVLREIDEEIEAWEHIESAYDALLALKKRIKSMAEATYNARRERP